MLTPQAHEASMQIARQARMQVGELMPQCSSQAWLEEFRSVPEVRWRRDCGVIGGVAGPSAPAKPLVETEESAEDSEVTKLSAMRRPRRRYCGGGVV